MITIISSPFMEGKEGREGRRSCCGLQQPVDRSHGHSHCFVSFLPFHWGGWRSSASWKGCQGRLCLVTPAVLPWTGVPCIPGGTAMADCGPHPREYHRRRGNREHLKGQDQPWRLLCLGDLFPTWILGIKWGSFWSAILWFLLASPLCG